MQSINHKLSTFIYLLTICISIIPTLFSMDSATQEFFDALDIADDTTCITMMKTALSKGASLNYESTQGTPLEKAVHLEKIEAIDFLIKKGSNVNFKNSSFNETPLHKAARIGNVVVIQKLLYEEAYLEPRNKLGQTPLHLAVIHRQIAAVREFIRLGLRVNAATKYLMTPLHYACMLRSINEHEDTEGIKIIQELIAHGASLTACEKNYNFTPLATAICVGNQTTVTFLLTMQHTKPFSSPDELKILLQISRESNNQTIIRLLQEALNNKY